MSVLGPLLKKALKKAKPIIQEAKGPLETKLSTKQMQPAKEALKVEQQVAKDAVPVKEVAEKQQAHVVPKEEPIIKPKKDDVVIPDAPAAAKKKIAEQTPLAEQELKDFDPEDAWQPNFDTFSSADDVKAVIGAMAERGRTGVQAARGGVQKDAEVMALAQELGDKGNVVQVALERQFGESFDVHTTVAMRQFIQKSAMRLKDLGTMINEGTAVAKDEAQFVRQHMLHQEVYSSFMGSRAETARRFRAHGIKISDDDFAMESMKELVNLTGMDVNKMAKVYANLDTTAQVTKANQGFAKNRFLAAAEEVWKNSILSGVKTFVVNMTGSPIMMIKDTADLVVASRLGKILGTEERALVGEAQAQVFGYMSAVGDAWRMASKAFKHGQSSAGYSKTEQVYPKAISSENLHLGGDLMRIADFFNLTIGDKLPKFIDKTTDAAGAAIRVPTERMLAPMDEFYSTMSRRGHVARMAFREASKLPDGKTDAEIAEFMTSFIENPPPNILQGADEAAARTTFQTPLGEIGQSAQKIVQKIPGAFHIAPFIRTPVNIFKVGMFENTPLGVFSAQVRNDVAAGGATRDMALARMSVGTSLAMLTHQQVISGNVSGAGPSDYRAKALLRATGWQPYSIKVTNPLTGETTYHSYQRAEPIAYIIGATADFAEWQQWKDEADDIEDSEELERMENHVSAALVAGIVENTLNKTFMSGAASFIEATYDPERYMSSYLDRLAGGYIPYSGLRRDITKVQDPYIREAWTFMDKMKKASGVAGWADDVPVKRNAYGDMLTHPSGDVLGIVDPFPTSKRKVSKVRDEVVRVMKESRTIPLGKPSKRIEGVKLNVHEYDRLIVLSRQEIEINGMNFNDSLSDLIESTMYEDATEDSKSDLIKDTQRSYDRIAKATLLTENDKLQERVNNASFYKAVKQVGKDEAENIFRR